jgi:hypothetical protein
VRPRIAVTIAATQPHSAALENTSPENNVRSASTTYESGLNLAATRIQPGPVSSGSSIPDRIISGNRNVCCTTQNIQSCLRTAIASA